jgi:hypothetical protein
MIGKTCSPDDTSSATCAGKLGFTCTKSMCSGTSLVDCQPAGIRMLDHGFDCAGVGAGKCVESDAGPYCAPSGGATACDGGVQSPPKCAGNLVVESCIDGQNIRIDCDKLGLGCNDTQLTSNDPTSACVARGTGACTPGTDTCDGSLLHSCGRGVIIDVDCASLGLGKCAVNVAGHGACGKPAN